MTARLPLAALQRWMLSVIAHPAGVSAGSAVGEGRAARLEEVILPGPQQTAAQRMAVYSNAYFARLLEVLRELFPCLRYAVGDEVFDSFAGEYLAAHPPSSYTLHRLADRFAEFLEATRPADDDSAAFVVDLARLEHAIDEVFDGPGPERLEEQGSEPPAGDSQLALSPGFRLLAFRFPASTYFTAWKAGHEPSWPEPGEQFVALLRRDYVVRRFELSATQFQLITQLAAGQALDQALGQALATIAGDRSTVDQLAADIEGWFRHWSAEGFFIVPATSEAPDRWPRPLAGRASSG